MKLDLVKKARDRRIEALSTLPLRRTRRVAMGGLNLVPAAGSEDFGGVYAAGNGYFEQNIFSV